MNTKTIHTKKKMAEQVSETPEPKAIVLNPCLHTICHGRSWGLALDNVVEIKHVRCCPADDCAGFFDITLKWERMSHPSFWSRRTEKQHNDADGTRWDVAEHVTFPAFISPGQSCRRRLHPDVAGRLHTKCTAAMQTLSSASESLLVCLVTILILLMNNNCLLDHV